MSVMLLLHLSVMRASILLRGCQSQVSYRFPIVFQTLRRHFIPNLDDPVLK